MRILAIPITGFVLIAITFSVEPIRDRSELRDSS